MELGYAATAMVFSSDDLDCMKKWRLQLVRRLYFLLVL